MNIHFYITKSFPHGMAAAKRRLCYAKGLIAAGDNVDVTICQKIYDIGEDDGFASKGLYEGIPYDYVCGKYKHAKKHRVLRGLDWNLLDFTRSFFYALSHIKRGDIVYIYAYPLYFQILILLASKIKGAKCIKETCEHPSALYGNGKWNKLCRWFEYHFVMPRYKGFIAISRELDKFVCKYKSVSAESIIVPILVEESLFDVDFAIKKTPYSVPYIIHTGTMVEQKDSISKIIKAFAHYKKEYKSDVKLVFTGPHANDSCKYIPMMEELGVRQDIELLGMVSVENVAMLQHFSTMTIIYKSDNLQTRNCFPTKLGEMLMSGTPVITTTIGDANLYLKNGESAFIIEPDDEKALLRCMHELLTKPQLAKRIGDNGKEVAKKYFNPFYQGQRLHDFFKKLINV